MAYDITKTDGTRLTIVADRTVDTTTPIKLLGKNYSAYGEIMAENLYHITENFAKESNPDSAKSIRGQIYYNTAEEKFYYFDKSYKIEYGIWLCNYLLK